MHVQLYQGVLGSLLLTNRLWRKGNRHQYPEIVAAVTSTVRGLGELAAYIGASATFAKCHDLIHIAVDLYACGSSIGSCTGTLSNMIGLWTNPITCDWIPVGPMESMHRVLKAVWPRTSRRPGEPGECDTELLDGTLLLEYNQTQVRAMRSANSDPVIIAPHPAAASVPVSWGRI